MDTVFYFVSHTPGDFWGKAALIFLAASVAAIYCFLAWGLWTERF